MLQVVTPAADLSLLTLEELRLAVGLESDDDSQDEKLEPLGERVSAMITAACRVVSDGTNPPTLMQEGVVDTFRLTSTNRFLFLSRRPVAQVMSVIEADVTLTEDLDFEVDPGSGKLIRLSNGDLSVWSCGKIVVEYDGGYETVPADLKAIAQQLAGGYWADEGVDPMEKSFSIPGVMSSERWVDTEADPQMPREIMNALTAGGYVNRAMVL